MNGRASSVTSESQENNSQVYARTYVASQQNLYLDYLQVAIAYALHRIRLVPGISV
jgi:hypothetical protein